MSPQNQNIPPNRFVKFSNSVASMAGKPASFCLACAVVLTWAITGPIFHYSDTWQLAINTGTTIITFLMVFLIQNSQNRDSAALQLKLNEIIYRLEGTSHHLMDAEEKTLDELVEMKKSYIEVAKIAHEELEREAADEMAREEQAETRDAIDAHEDCNVVSIEQAKEHGKKSISDAG